MSFEENQLGKNEDWVRYFTVTNYFTVNEMEYRRNGVIKSGCDFEKILKSVHDYRNKTKTLIFEYNNKKFFLCETQKIKNKIDEMKIFYKTIAYHLKERYADKLILDSLIMEAFSSSSIEGAHSTVKRINEMIVKKEDPKDKSELMIFNNFKAIEYLKDKNDELTDDFVCKIHRIVSEGTLEKKEYEGCYRREANEIINNQGKTIFSPTANIKEMEEMLAQLYLFLLDNEFDRPLESTYKAIAFHFLFSYIHPFMDGNGRTVRVLFSYLLKKYGMDMFYNISLSEVIYKPENLKKYYKAFIDVERSAIAGEFDLTYFFYFFIEIMPSGIEILEERIKSYLREDIIISKAGREKIDLTPRQKRIIQLLSSISTSFMKTSKDLGKKLKLSPQTILKDLKYLKDFKLIQEKKIGRKIFYSLKIENDKNKSKEN